MNHDIHILVVEDDGDINRLLCQIIQDAGYTPQPAFSGTEALMYLEKKSMGSSYIRLNVTRENR